MNAADAGVAVPLAELAEDHRHPPRDRLELVVEGRVDVLALDEVVDVGRRDELVRRVGWGGSGAARVRSAL